MKAMIPALVIASLVFASTAAALGLSPVKTIVDFEPGASSTHGFNLISTVNREMDLSFRVDGALKDYITLSQDTMHFESGQSSQSLGFSLDLPNNLPPGPQEGYIIIEEMPSQDAGGSTLSATFQMYHRVIVSAPYPEKHAEAGLSVAASGEDISITTVVRNVGTMDISSLRVRFDVFDGDELLDYYVADDEELKAGSEKEFIMLVEKGSARPGEYTINSTVDYDGNLIPLSKGMKIGKPYVEIMEYDQVFVSDQINRFDVAFMNKWNRPVTAFAVIHISREGEKVSEIKTISFETPPWRKEIITAYLDARKIEPGEYDASLTAHYENMTSEKQFTINVLTLREYEERKNLSNYIILIAIIAALAVIVYWFWFRK
jgi:hypothetical protein